MNVQGIVHEYFSGCQILVLANEDFDGAVAFGPYYVTHTGTLPNWADVEAKSQSYDEEINRRLKKSKLFRAANKYYEQLIEEGFNYQGKVYQIDDGSLSVMNRFMSGLLAGFPNPHGGYWRAMDNTRTEMNDAELTAFITAAGVYTDSLRRKLHDKKDEIRNCQNTSELSAVNIQSGWFSYIIKWNREEVLMNSIIVRKDNKMFDFTPISRFKLEFEDTDVSIDTDVNAEAIKGDSKGVLSFAFDNTGLDLPTGLVKATLTVYDAAHPEGQKLFYPQDTNDDLVFNIMSAY